MPRPTDDDVRAALSDPHQLPHELRASVRTLWANLGALPNQSPGRILLITSAAAGEGSPAVAALLAAVVARTGTSVTLIDADLERGPLASMVDGEARSVPSLGRLLASDDLRSGRPGSSGGRARKSAAPSAVLPLVSSQQLQVLLADPEDRQLTEWLPPERLSALVVQLRRQVKLVVVSAPPLPAAETTVLTNLADAVIITVAVGRTRRARLTRLREELAERGVVPAGFVVLERSSAQMRIAHLPSMPSVQIPSKLSVRRRWA
jgi:Mrp family chromosome partitioning ATPase